ncbi:RNA-directed DNA polymerase-like protein [Gossypium australe]|uniref:RNA-directed DNA polymerase-like protein n=1 Tax=Gossypium australe TaxID=47621 RepID=A0A5B6WS92_9ROSI|nr:RNA-directed DNA polymerase-like protein [Gossypium australe]
MFQLYLGKFFVVFIVDILIYSNNEIEHAQHLRTIFQTLQEKQLYAKINKCEFWLLLILHDGILVYPNKIFVVVNWMPPRNVSEFERCRHSFKQSKAMLTQPKLRKNSLFTVMLQQPIFSQIGIVTTNMFDNDLMMIRHWKSRLNLRNRWDTSDMSLGDYCDYVIRVLLLYILTMVEYTGMC